MAVGIEWDKNSLVLVREGACYARMIRLHSGDILSCYDVAGRIHVNRSLDEGRTWDSETFVAAADAGSATNAEILQLHNGWILLSFNQRPVGPSGEAGKNPFAIKLCVSKDGGRSWSGPQTLFEADVVWENGCWEPAQIQLPDGEVQLFFANESPYRESNEQEISLMRSKDNGLTWSEPERIIFRSGHRDGMPVPLVLLDGKGVVVAIEDNGMGGVLFQPAIVHTDLEDNWTSGTVTGDSPKRRWAFPNQPIAQISGGAPYIRQLSSGETLLSYQAMKPGFVSQMVVYIGDSEAVDFDHKTEPFGLPAKENGLWNSLFIKESDTVTAISTTCIDGKSGIWAIDGRVVRALHPQPADMAQRTEELKNLRWGMFICWSFSTFSGMEWTRDVKDVSFFRATEVDTEQWVRTAQEAGMGYILFLTKHHDGFCLWDTKTTDWKVTNAPLGQDVLAALRTSCDRHGIRLALYFSEGDWTWPNMKNAELKKEQLRELLTHYGPIEYIWFDHAQTDGGLSHADTVTWCKQFQPGCFIGFNHGERAGDIQLGEHGRPGPVGIKTGVGKDSGDEAHSGYLVAEFTYPILPKGPQREGGADWFYSLPEHDEKCHPAEKLYQDYLGAVKYGNIFSINIGPDYQGKLRDIDVKTLRQVGEMIKSFPPGP